MYSIRFSRRRLAAAFTLIELLVVIVIIGILVGIALPVYNQFTVKSQQTATLNNMKQVGTAFLLYAGDNNYQLPGRVTAGDKWPKLLSPYVGNLNVYYAPIPGYVGTTHQVTDPTLLVSNLTPNNTEYMLNGYNDIGGYTSAAVTPRLNIISTPSQVILLGIRNPSAGDFYMDFVEKNEVNELDKAPAASAKAAPWSGSVYVFCDGSARFLQDYPAGDTSSGTVSKPPNGSLYTDWLWLVDKNNASNPTGH